MNKLLISFCILFFVFSLSSCSSVGDKLGYIEKSKASQELDLAISQKQIDLENAVGKIIAAKDLERNQLEDNFQKNADELFGANIALQVEINKSRPVEIAFTHVIAAAAYAPKPSLEGVLKQQGLLKKELDTQKVSNDDLQRRLSVTLADAGVAQKLLKDKELEVAQAIEAKKTVEINDEIKINAAQKKLNDANSKIITAQNISLEDKAAREKERMWLIGIFTFIGIAMGVAAIFSPILKKQFTIGAGGSLAIAVGIVLVPQWVITTVACLVFAILLGWILYDVIISHKAASNTYRAIQEVKDTKPDVYSQIKPTLTNWQTKYAPDGTLIPDNATINKISTTLKKTDSL